jgi:hypothetical protein
MMPYRERKTSSSIVRVAIVTTATTSSESVVHREGIATRKSPFLLLSRYRLRYSSHSSMSRRHRPQARSAILSPRLSTQRATKDSTRARALNAFMFIAMLSSYLRSWSLMCGTAEVLEPGLLSGGTIVHYLAAGRLIES